ncbi:MAG: hypothetical protein FWB75_00990 [Oscillospiraceae bacterium]|nr:hypothetical protein [Oscillospiraceae bacterium]
MAINTLNPLLRSDAATVEKEYQLKEVEKTTQPDKKIADPSHKPVQDADAFDSAPTFEYYNNYTQSGKNYYDLQVQEPLHSELALANIEAASSAGVEETRPYASAAPMTEIDRLVQALQENDEFMRIHSSRNRHDLWGFDEWQELGRNFIENLSDEDYELLQKMLWTRMREDLVRSINDRQWLNEQVRNYEQFALNWLHKGSDVSFMVEHQVERKQMNEDRIRFLKDNATNSHLELDLVSIWNTPPSADSSVVAGSSFESFLSNNFRTVVNQFINLSMKAGELTDAGRLLNPGAAYTESMQGPGATFSNRMGSVADYVNARFAEAQRPLPKMERFTITFNNDLTFQVRGGTSDDAEFMQGILNNAGSWLMDQVMSSIRFHRGENGEVHPLLKSSNTWQRIAIDRGFGFIEMPDEFLNGLPKLAAVQHRQATDELIRRVHGFGLDDVYIKNGELRGRTDEITDIIRNDPRFKALHHESAIKSAINIPREHDLSFFNMTFENGRFSLIH